MARVVALGVPHHVTQRGNRRRDVFLNDEFRQVYLDLVAEHAQINGLRIQAYCIMTNHVHIVAIPERGHSLASTFRNAHGRFAQFWNTASHRVGHMWQNRFYSCPVEPQEAWRVIRYVELNPVRAGIVRAASDYQWSSARVHMHLHHREQKILDMSNWKWTAAEWAALLMEVPETDAETIRQATYTGRPWGSEKFTGQLEQELDRNLAARKGGRPRKVTPEISRQGSLW